MKCPRCNNEDIEFFYKGSNGYYCRKCVSFKRILIEEDLDSFDYDVNKDSNEYSFDYELTPYQKEASNNMKEELKERDVLLYAVCGAGKTEISVESISDYLSRGLKVCYAISRREVVKELAIRFSKIFSKARVCAIYGGHHNTLSGDLIICTTHQLYRFYKSFDLLILDEVDAFPLKGNDTLMNIALNSCKGRVVFSTATINDFVYKYLNKRDYKCIKLSIRPSLVPLEIPKVYYGPLFFQIFCLYKKLHSMTNQCIIFVSSKKYTRMMYQLFKHFFSCTYVYSDLKQRDENIKDFKDKKYQFIFSTSILERGITIDQVSVCIMNENENVFDESSYIQMTGRVKRGISPTIGEAFIFSLHKSKEIDKCLANIKEANSYYEMSLL